MQEEVTPADRRRAKLLKGLGTGWKSIGAVIATVAAALALAFDALPGCAPDPRNVLAGTLEVKKVEPGVRYDEFLRRIDEAPEKDPDFYCEIGSVVYLSLRVEGRKHDGLNLYQWLYDASTGRRVHVGDRADGLDSDFEPDTPNDQWIQPVFVATTGYENVFARLELFDGNTMLGVVDTKRLQTTVPKGTKNCP